MSDETFTDAEVDDSVGMQGDEQAQAPTDQNQRQQTSASSPDDSRDYEETDESTDARQETDLPSREERQAIGKLQQVQQEAKAAQERAAQYERQFSTLVQNASRTPETYKQALMNMRGWDEQQAQAYVEQIKAAGQAPESWYSYGDQGRQTAVQNAQMGQPNQMPDIYSLTQKAIADHEARKEAETQQREQLREVSEYFFEQVPEMNPKTMNEERKSSAAVLMDAVQFEATRRVQQNPSLDFKEELVKTYQTMTGRTSEDLERMREDAKLEGYLESQSGNVAAGVSAKGASPKGSKHGLTPEQMRQAKAEGYSYERFAELMQSNETTVG